MVEKHQIEADDCREQDIFESISFVLIVFCFCVFVFVFLYLCYFVFEFLFLYFYRTRVRSLAMLVMTHSLTDSLTHCRLVNLIDVTLAYEDANSKLVEVVSVAYLDAENHVDDSLVQIWKLKFGFKVKILFRL